MYDSVQCVECGHTRAQHGKLTTYCWAKLGDESDGLCQCPAFRAPAVPPSPAAPREELVCTTCGARATNPLLMAGMTHLHCGGTLRFLPAPPGAETPTPDLAECDANAVRLVLNFVRTTNWPEGEVTAAQIGLNNLVSAIRSRDRALAALQSRATQATDVERFADYLMTQFGGTIQREKLPGITKHWLRMQLATPSTDTKGG